MTDLSRDIEALARRARDASHTLAALSSREKDGWLEAAAARLEAAKSAILEANQVDLREARDKGLSEPMVKRLDLAEKWNDMVAGLRDVAALPDPVGEMTEVRVRPNGLRVGRMRIPLGVVAMIYESRPNVTADPATFCSSIATCSMTWPSQVPSSSRRRRTKPPASL